MKRIRLPLVPMQCPYTSCPYCDVFGICDCPRENKRQSDADCFMLRNVELLPLLKPLDQE